MYNQDQKNNCPSFNGPCNNERPSQDPSCQQENYCPGKNKKNNKPCGKNKNQNNY
ncbi:MAG: hypothetical protein R3Y27_08670 [Clostridia bacterium]